MKTGKKLLKKIFDPQNKILRFCEKILDLVLLNLLFLVGSIPILTIGTSLGALFGTILKWQREEETSLYKDFIHLYKANLKQGTLLSSILIAIVCVLSFDLFLMSQNNVMWFRFLTAIIYGMFLLIFAYSIYLFALLGRYEDTTSVVLKNAFLMSIVHLPKTALIMAVGVLPFFLLFLNLYTFIIGFTLFILLGFSTIAFFQGIWINQIFTVYELQQKNPLNTDVNEFSGEQIGGKK